MKSHHHACIRPMHRIVERIQFRQHAKTALVHGRRSWTCPRSFPRLAQVRRHINVDQCSLIWAQPKKTTVPTRYLATLIIYALPMYIRGTCSFFSVPICYHVWGHQGGPLPIYIPIHNMEKSYGLLLLSNGDRPISLLLASFQFMVIGTHFAAWVLKLKCY